MSRCPIRLGDECDSPKVGGDRTWAVATLVFAGATPRENEPLAASESWSRVQTQHQGGEAPCPPPSPRTSALIWEPAGGRRGHWQIPAVDTVRARKGLSYPDSRQLGQGLTPVGGGGLTPGALVGRKHHPAPGTAPRAMLGGLGGSFPRRLYFGRGGAQRSASGVPSFQVCGWSHRPPTPPMLFTVLSGLLEAQPQDG